MTHATRLASVVKSNKYYEVQKFVSKTDHILTVAYTVANPKFYDALAADEKTAFDARVKSLITDVPNLPNFSRFHDAFRENPKSITNEGDMRTPFFLAYDAANLTHVKLHGKEIDELVKNGQAVSAKFVIPYPPGFPIMVPGQVITAETIEFMRKLDVKEIHGYQAALGLELIRPEKLGATRKKGKK